MASPSRERTLRIVILVLCGLAFPLVVAAGCMSDRVQPDLLPIWFGFIPLGISACVSVTHLICNRNRQTALDNEIELQPRRKIWARLLMITDWFLAAGYFSTLVPIWVIEPKRLNIHADYMMLETYATCFFITNMVIHIYLAHSNPESFCALFMGFGSHKCPRCYGKMVYNGPDMAIKKGSEGYSLLRGEDYLDEDAVEYGVVAGPSEPRASEDGPSDDKGTEGKSAIDV